VRVDALMSGLALELSTMGRKMGPASFRAGGRVTKYVMHHAREAAAKTAGMARRKLIISEPSAQHDCLRAAGRDYRDLVLMPEENRCLKSPVKDRTSALLSNRFDCANSEQFNRANVWNAMYEAITAFLVVLSVGILVAHALDAFRS
jgi:hypothetical protein